MLTGTLDNFAGRMGSLLFKQGVDLNVLGQIIAYDTDIDEGEYQRLRGRAIRDMKRTNGRISFKDALDFQKSCNPWRSSYRKAATSNPKRPAGT